MAEFSGATISMEADSQKDKAAALDEIITSIVNKVYEIDDEIEKLVKGGIEGSAVETMSQSYLKNRETISNYVKTFAALEASLEINAGRNKNINLGAAEAAEGKAI